MFFKICINTCVLWFQTAETFRKYEQQGHTYRINLGVADKGTCDFWRDDWL